jgi:ferredoxin
MKYLSNLTTLRYFPEKCTGCGRCIEVCPRAVFTLRGNKAYCVDKNLCIECGACKNNCAFGAIEVNTGVGCAEALIFSLITGKEPACGCSEQGNSAAKCC